MELRQLEQFVTVAELSSFTRAAQRLHVVQSGVSATVQSLEHDLGARLFERGARGVRLTPAGAALLPQARATLDAARAAREAVEQASGGVAGEIRFGTLVSTDVVDLPALLAQLRSDHPGVRARLTTSASGTRGLIELLTAGELDAALVAGDGSPIPGLRMIHLLSTTIIAQLPAGHPLAASESVQLTDLAGEPFIDFPAGYGNRRVVDDAFEQLGLQRQVVVEVSDITDAAAYVGRGLGVSLVPAITPLAEPGVVAVPVRRPKLPWVVSVATLTTRTPTAPTQALLSLIPAHVTAPP
jgi:DNA-binding transcriptional LysR family regulator